MICTPMFGGQCTSEYFLSCLDLREDLVRSGLKHTWLVTTNESLIPRARNTSVAKFMASDYDVLMFIDADIEFKSEDVQKLWNLDKEVSCAAYPMKRPGSDVTAWKDGKLVKLDDLEGPTPVDYAGTGFLMIKRNVFKRMQFTHKDSAHTEGHVGQVFDIFPTRVSEGETWQDRYYVSEDYAFCENWRNMGGEIILEPSIRLGHVGRHVYRG